MTDAARRSSTITATSVGLLAVLLIATLVVFGIRLDSVIRQGDLRETSGCEVSNIYNIWKVRHGAPLYQQPDEDPYSLTAYNAGFYHTYAAVLSGLHVSDERSALGARLITLCFAVVGAVGQWILVRELTIVRTTVARFIALAVVVLTWFGGVVSWWAMTARPDIAGVAMITWALAILAHQPLRARLPRLLCVSLLFTAAWTFKHSLVWALGGCCLFLLFRRDVRAIVALLVPLAIVASAMLFLGSDAYRFNLLHIHQDFTFNWRAGPLHMAAVLLVGGWFWALPLIVFLAGAAPRAWPARDHPETRTSDAAWMLACGAAISFLFAMLAMSKDGADRNYVFESLVPSASLAGAALIHLLHRPYREARSLLLAANALLLALLILPAALIAGIPQAGRIRLLGPDEEQRARALRQMAQTAPKPLYAREPMLSLPWVSTNDQYPAFVLDENFAYLPTLLARAEHPLLRGRVTSHYFASLLLPNEDDALYPIARDAGYRAGAPAVPHAPVLLIAPSAREN